MFALQRGVSCELSTVHSSVLCSLAFGVNSSGSGFHNVWAPLKLPGPVAASNKSAATANEQCFPTDTSSGLIHMSQSWLWACKCYRHPLVDYWYSCRTHACVSMCVWRRADGEGIKKKSIQQTQPTTTTQTWWLQHHYKIWNCAIAPT